eukprot:351132-Chlamydomonas_euryale.AAC.1
MSEPPGARSPGAAAALLAPASNETPRPNALDGIDGPPVGGGTSDALLPPAAAPPSPSPATPQPLTPAPLPSAPLPPAPPPPASPPGSGRSGAAAAAVEALAANARNPTTGGPRSWLRSDCCAATAGPPPSMYVSSPISTRL